MVGASGVRERKGARAIDAAGPGLYVLKTGEFAKDSPGVPKLSSIVAFVCLAAVPFFAVRGEVITLDGAKRGKTFEGLGALSAGASSRLLFDYPEPQRSEILDFLFKPNFGAALQHLKVEIGGDVNSTDGTEPSIARTRGEFADPRPEYFNRGYEWWLMKEAKKRNPDIVFDALQWGAPGWVGNGKLFSQDNADLIAAFIRGAKKYHDIDISYCGIWNERPYDAEWIKLLRRTLNKAGLENVQIVAADEVNKWTIADKMAGDPQLREAVQVIGTHYPRFDAPAIAHSFGKPVWSSEDGPWSGRWDASGVAAGPLMQLYNRNYIVGKMTKTIIWSPVTAYYDILTYPGSGLMRANQPWSGHYEVQPGIWITAHTTQFFQPGWKYLDGACGFLWGGGSCVAAVAPDGKAFSVVVETLRAKQSQPLKFRIAGGLAGDRVRVWRSDAQQQFVRQPDESVTDGAFEITVDPDAIYSLTTTDGQRKGETVIPASAPMPMPYFEDFSSYESGRTPRWISDIFGVFETGKAEDGRACLIQKIPERGISWKNDATPVTLVGETSWSDYEVSCDVLADFKKHAAIFGRITKVPNENTVPEGYTLRIASDGKWQLNAFDKKLASGRVDLPPGRWCLLALRMQGERITASIDGKEVAAVSDKTYTSGPVALGCDYEPVKFTALQVTAQAKR